MEKITIIEQPLISLMKSDDVIIYFRKHEFGQLLQFPEYEVIEDRSIKMFEVSDIAKVLEPQELKEMQCIIITHLIPILNINRL